MNNIWMSATGRFLVSSANANAGSTTLTLFGNTGKKRMATSYQEEYPQNTSSSSPSPPSSPSLQPPRLQSYLHQNVLMRNLIVSPTPLSASNWKRTMQSTWMIPSRVNKHIQLEYVIFARGAYLDESDGHMKLGGEQVSPIIWADTLMALTRGQETSFSRLADNKYFINSTADEGKECEDCGCLISWRSSLLRFNGKTGPLTFPGTKYCNVCYIRRRRDKGETIAKESYGVEGPVSKLWTLPAIQPLIDEQLQDMYCRGHDCGIKLSKENAIYDRSSSMDHYPFIVRSLCKDCNRKAKKGSFMGAVDRWARRRMKKDRPCVFASLDQARMAFVVTYIQGYCVGAPQLSVALFQELVQVASHLRQLCFWCGSQLRYERGTDPRVRKSIDRTTFVSGVSLPYGHPDQIMVLSCASCNSIFSDRDILERIEYLDQLAKEMPAGVVWGDMVLDKIENFDEELERNRPDVDPYLRKSYDTFLRHRINKGKEHRIQHWTFEKYRFYLEVCERQSVVSGMKPRKCCDFDRCINTDPYDLHTVVYMEREINFMKQDFLEFQNDDEFKRSKEKSRTRWAVNVLRKHLFKLIDDTNELKLGWESRIEKMKKNPLPCLHFHQTPLLTRAEDTSIVESSSSPPAQVQTQPSTQAVTPTQGPIVHARYSLQNKR
ncbi:hypothetical protein EDD21DRAFT_403235, partial [Dissophora ornata]